MQAILRLLTTCFVVATLGLGFAHAKDTKETADAKVESEHKGHFKQMIEELNLSAEQKEKAKKIHENGHEALVAKKTAMKKAHEDLEAALKGSASDDEVRAKFAALQKAQEEFGKARFDKVMAFRAILTPEQRAKMKSPREMHRGGRGDDDD